MEQMKIPEEARVTYNYEAPDVPEMVKEFRPTLFRDDNDYCCVLGPNPQMGIFGCGISQEEALRNWQHNLKRRITDADDNDEVAQYIIEALKASNKKVW
ncbi:hypothetical protein GCM10023231_13760 [Olivibacter ginsenosidimutans]|uniref:Uncharacterized protein n=1 Tax=Olivibacter ginsenosidimutans TaxID=1176537 RepID=A0ABP9AVN7_9SPHI